MIFYIAEFLFGLGATYFVLKFVVFPFIDSEIEKYKKRKCKGAKK